MLDLVSLFSLALWSIAVGRAALRTLGCRPRGLLEHLALSLPLGLGILGLATLGLGEAGALTPPGLALVLLLGGSLGLRDWLRHPLPSPTIQAPSPDAGPPSWIDWILDASLALTVLTTLLAALTPVTDGDALCYHLQVPKLFLQAREVGFEPDLHETVYPLLIEMLYAVGLAFRGPVVCRLIQWILGISLAASVTVAARPWLGRRARWAGTIALLTPAINNGMCAPLNDVALAAYGMTCLVAWLRWLETPTPRAAALAGGLAALAAGVKYPALVWAGLLGLAMTTLSLGRFRSQPLRLRLFQPMAFGATFVLGACWWYLRAYAWTGNPVHPFFRGTFGGAGLDEVLVASWRPMRPTILNLLTALWPMTLDPDRFDSFSHQFGPLFLMILPILLIARPPRRIVGILALGYTFMLICLTQRQSMRFVLIAVGPMAVAAGWLLAEWVRANSPGRSWLAFALILVLGFESSLAAARTRHGFAAAVGLETHSAYLTRREPTFTVGRWIDARLEPTARIVGQDHRGFYIPRPYTMELAHRRRTGLGKRGESAVSIIRQLRQRGFTHLLLCPPVPENAVEFDPTLSRLLIDWLQSHDPIYRREFDDSDGVRRRYAIFDLRERQTIGLASRSDQP